MQFLHGEYWVLIFLYPLIAASLAAAVLCTTSNCAEAVWRMETLI